MSRVGKQPVAIPGNVNVTVNGRDIVVECGPKKLSYTHRPEVSVQVDKDAKQVVVTRADDSRIAKAMHGLTRALVANMVTGVTKGFVKELEIHGVGWTAQREGQMIALNVGYADTRRVAVPPGVDAEIIGNNRIKISGPDKQAVGQLAAVVRSQRPPEPYNGKGIKYSDERIIRKAGKALAGAG